MMTIPKGKGKRKVAEGVSEASPTQKRQRVKKLSQKKKTTPKRKSEVVQSESDTQTVTPPHSPISRDKTFDIPIQNPIHDSIITPTPPTISIITPTPPTISEPISSAIPIPPPNSSHLETSIPQPQIQISEPIPSEPTPSESVPASSTAPESSIPIPPCPSTFGDDEEEYFNESEEELAPIASEDEDDDDDDDTPFFFNKSHFNALKRKMNVILKVVAQKDRNVSYVNDFINIDLAITKLSEKLDYVQKEFEDKLNQTSATNSDAIYARIGELEKKLSDHSAEVKQGFDSISTLFNQKSKEWEIM